jgi:ATP-dependent DNA helicase 2 subunit 2
MVERAGYTLVVYAIDVSSSMAKEQLDPETGKTKSKLDLVKEYVARECEPKVSDIGVSCIVACILPTAS